MSLTAIEHTVLCVLILITVVTLKNLELSLKCKYLLVAVLQQGGGRQHVTDGLILQLRQVVVLVPDLIL